MTSRLLSTRHGPYRIIQNQNFRGFSVVWSMFLRISQNFQKNQWQWLAAFFNKQKLGKTRGLLLVLSFCRACPVYFPLDGVLNGTFWRVITKPFLIILSFTGALYWESISLFYWAACSWAMIKTRSGALFSKVLQINCCIGSLCQYWKFMHWLPLVITRFPSIRIVYRLKIKNKNSDNKKRLPATNTNDFHNLTWFLNE